METDKPPRTHRSGHIQPHFFGRHRGTLVHSADLSPGLREASSPQDAQPKDSGSGLAPATEGWFVVNVRDAEWWFTDTRYAACNFENENGETPVEFAQFGINLTVLKPGQSNGFYHAESAQEAFLVLSGECRLLVEGEERLLGPWDFFHSPPLTEHIFVGAGNGPCVILMAGSRAAAIRSEEWEVRYPVSELAARYGARVAEETSDPAQAYTEVEWFRRERPPYWARLPWA
jgi:uncharacterized cupin superfamily protein